MIKKFLPSSIRGKIMAVTAAITVLIAVITMAVCYSVFQSFLMKNQIQSTEFNLSVVSSNMAEDMKEIVTFTKWCCSNSEVGHYLERLKDQPKLPTASKDTEGLRLLRFGDKGNGLLRRECDLQRAVVGGQPEGKLAALRGVPPVTGE